MSLSVKCDIKNRMLTAGMLLLLLFFFNSVKGQKFNFPVSSGSAYITGDELATSSLPYSKTVWCNDWDYITSNPTTWRDEFLLKSNVTIVKFYVDHFNTITKYLTPVSYNSYHLLFQIKGYTNPLDTTIFTSNSDTLTINYNNSATNAPFQDINLKKYSNFYKVELTINGIYEDVGGSLVPATLSDAALRNFRIEASITTQRYDKKEYGSGAPATLPIITMTPYVTDNYLDLSWAFSTGPVTPISYELEWTYLDNYNVSPAGGIMSPLTPSSLYYNFQSNNTKVWLDKSSYRIPLIYSSGYIVYRVRAVRPDSLLFKYPIYGDWSIPGGDFGHLSDLTPGSAYFQISKPYTADSLNWQYTTSFAEGGKYKNVASFYDGLLKNRQSITRFNSSLDKLIVTNNIYDFEGRLSIKTLPAPVDKTSFDFQHNVDLNVITHLPYKAADFDTGLFNYNVIPSFAPDALASKYYSNQNPDTLLRYQKFIPNAQGYPFVQTIFEPGYNDRVSAQGGAGRTLQIGDANYILNSYVDVDQPVINSLFGPNIGWSSFYTKTISRDPNQQRSMVIKDYHGKQLASALIGTGPSSATHALNRLNTANPISLRTDLLAPGPSKQTTDYLAGTITANTNYFSESQAVDTLQYFYNFTPFSTPCPGKYLSVQGHYHTSVTDQFGNELTAQDNILGTNGVVSSATPYSYTGPISTFPVDIGPYHVNKTLSFAPSDINNVLNDFFAGAMTSCLLTEPYFVRQSVEKVEFPCKGTPVDPLDDSDECVKMKWKMMQQLFPNAVYAHYSLVGPQVRGTHNSIYTMFGCPVDTFHVPASYPDSVMWHCYDNAYAVLGGDSSSIIASEHQFGIVNYRCFCASIAFPSLPGCITDTTFTTNVTITVQDLYDSTKKVYFPFVPASGGMTGNFTVQCDNWNFPTMNSAIYSSGVAIGDVHTVLGTGGHTTTTLTMPVSVSGNMYTASITGTSSAGDPLTFNFSGYMPSGHIDSMHHFIHYYTYDSTAVDYTSPSCYYRYQDTCTLPSLKDTITVGGVLHSGLRTMSAADFTTIYNEAITEGNYRIAEELLPLHPQYCSLNNCFSDTFKTRVLSIPDWRTADALGLLRIDDLVAHDPLVALLGASMPSSADSLLTYPGGTKRLDSFIFISAYCSCRDSIMFQHCYTEMFNYEIANHLLITNDAKELYFKNMYNAYFSNRQRFIDSLLVTGGNTCSHCALARMNLVPGGAVIPAPLVIDTPVITFAGPGGSGNWLRSMFTDDETSVLDSAITMYRAEDSSLCAATVDTIVAHIANCIAGNSALESHIRDDLRNLYTLGQVSMGNYSYGQIYKVLSDNGVAMNDLCNPYIINLSQLGTTTAGNNCLPQSYYLDLNNLLQLSQAIDALTHPGTPVGPVTIDTSFNQVAVEIAHNLGNVNSVLFNSSYDAGSNLYTLNVTSASGGPDVVKIFLHQSGDCTSPMPSILHDGGAISTDCISTVPSLASGTGVINRYSFAATVTSHDLSTTCYFTGWIDRVHTMVHQDDNVTSPCMPCTQMRSLYTQFNDTLHTYGILGPDHPCYMTMLTNFMNGHLHEQYSSSDYETFIQSCALADSMLMPLYVGYSTFQFGSAGEMDAFITALNAVDPKYNFDDSYRDYSPFSSPAVTVCVDLNKVPEQKLWVYKNFLNGYATPGIVNHPLSDLQHPGQVGFIYVNPLYPFDPVASISMPGSSVSISGPYNKSVWIGGSFVAQTFYDVNSSGATPSDISRAVYTITAYLYNHNLAGVTFVPNFKSTIDADYFKPEKQSYLQYTYGFQGLPDYQVLSNVQTQNLVVNIPSYTPYKAIYSRPQAPGIFTNLYLWNPGMNSRYFDTLKHIFDLVSPGGNIFGTSPSISYPPAALNAYICADKTYWYRYFTTGDTMFNVYLAFPGYISPALRPLYSIVGNVLPMPGDSLNRYFAVRVVRPGSTDTLQLFGLTNFVIGKSIELDNVLMRRSPLADNAGADTFDNCEREKLLSAVNEGVVNYNNYMDSLKDNISGAFRDYIMNNTGERLMLSYTNDEQQFTLYNYDRAGNLAWTEPPAGVVRIPDVGTTLSDIDDARKNNTTYAGPYSWNKRNTYEYNSYNNLVRQQTINNTGPSTFLYDAAGRLVFSQNAKQASVSRYTYNLYDDQGRIMETGEAMFPPSMPAIASTATVPYASIVAAVQAVDRYDVVMTIYDTAATHLETMLGFDGQQNLRKRVSCVKYFKTLLATDPAFAHYDYATHYSYDLQGNVQTLTQDNPALAQFRRRYIRIDYDYDLISGKVNMLSYNRTWPEQFYQKYSYDDDNRITEVCSSNDGYIWSREARYSYYDHGPLARVELGNYDMRVQGIDYAYTIQGWLKAANTDTLADTLDIGGDGLYASVTASDAMAHSIDYFTNDYTAITGRQLQHLSSPVTRSLYNGNIARQTVAIDNFMKLNKQYVYDQLNRIVSADYATVDPVTGALNHIEDFHNRYTYDPDGNIQTLLRYGNNTGSGAHQMDSLHYVYNNGLHDDKLNDVYDSAANAYTNDLQQYTTVTPGRYDYDQIGNMTADRVSGQDIIQWNLYNKVTMTNNLADASTLKFDYDGAGNRVGKHYTKVTPSNTKTRHEYYVHDAQGNILATYIGHTTMPVPATPGPLLDFGIAEHNLYGSSRLGIKQYYGLETGVLIDSTTPTPTYDTSRLFAGVPWYSLEYQDVIKTDSTNLYGNAFTDMYFAHHAVGQRQYELTDHLGNVLTTISDKRAGKAFTAYPSGPLTTGGLAKAKTWKPIVISAHDYYPFGEYMPGRYKTDLSSNCMTATLQSLVPHIYTIGVPGSTLVYSVTPVAGGVPMLTSIAPPLGGPPATPHPMMYIKTTSVGSGGYVGQYISAGGTSITVDVYASTGTHSITVTDGAGAPLSIPLIVPASSSPVAYPITISPVPHSHNIVIGVYAMSSGISGVIIDSVHIPLDTTTAYNIVSTVCDNDFYRFGFNGKQKDNEWAGLGNHVDFGARGLDTRIGRWISKDPLSEKYPGVSSYVYVLNTPIRAYDPDGKVVEFADVGAQKLFNRIYNSASAETKAKIDVLKNSDIVYYIQTSSQTDNGRAGSTSYDFDNNRMDIKIQQNYKTNGIGALGDELETCSQFENGDMGYTQKNNGDRGTLGYDMKDEVATKRAELAAIDAVSKAEGKTIKLDKTTEAFKKADTDPVPSGKTRDAMIEDYFKTDPSAQQYLPLFDNRGANMGTSIPGNGGYSQGQLDGAVKSNQFKYYIYRQNENGKNTTVTNK